MRQFVYLDKEHLYRWADSGGDAIIEGTAFEWPGENITYAFTGSPRFKMTGSPAEVRFIRHGSSRDLTMEDCLNANVKSGTAKSITMVFISPQKNIKAYVLKGNSIGECEVRFMPEESELYSRSKGLLETQVLADRRVLIIGLGSFGSHIAIELAKAGIGKFMLVDFDRLEPSNLSRHISGLAELGRYKTHAIKDAILLKNPFAEIDTHEIDINNELKMLWQLIAGADLVICVTDNNRSRFNVNAMSIQLNKVVLFGRAITRAEGGDIFRVNGNERACYNCLVGNTALAQVMNNEEISSIRQAEKIVPAYTSREEKESFVQVGLSSDILPICNMVVKLALVELSKGRESGLGSLTGELSYNYYLWANRREKQYANWGAFSNSENKPTILRWYGVNIPKNAFCISCSDKQVHE